MSRVIPRETAEEFQGWQPPSVGGAPTNASHVTARQLEEVSRQAYEEGFALGRREGLAAGRAQLEALLAALAEPYAGLEQAAMDELVVLIRAVAQQLVRRELRADPGEIVGLVREAMGVLPATARHVRLHLHPEDAALVRELLPVSESENHWRIVEDPGQARGGCRVHTESSQIDASLETRLNAVVARMLGGEREGD